MWDHDAYEGSHRGLATDEGARAWASGVGEASAEGSVPAFADVDVHGKHQAAVAAAAAHRAHAVRLSVTGRRPGRIGRPGNAHDALLTGARHELCCPPSHGSQARVRVTEAHTLCCLLTHHQRGA